MKNLKLFTAFIRERQRILERRRAGKPPPWTSDPILRRYRFCNVHREDDIVTKWIAKNWRTPYSTSSHLWFAMCIARLINWPPTLAVLGFPKDGWDPKRFMLVVRCMQDAGDKAYSGAYIVSTNGRAMPKEKYLAEHVLTKLWNNSGSIRPRSGDTLDAFHQRLMKFDGMGSFLAAQVVADMKYVPPLKGAADWWSFAASGPGSRRGLNRVYGLPFNKPITEQAWRNGMVELCAHAEYTLGKDDRLHAQDLQNCLCEFDKYERTRLGEGRPRSTYTPHHPSIRRI
jgi:hypothetical protein